MSKLHTRYDVIRCRFVFPVLIIAICALVVAACIGFVYDASPKFWLLVGALGTSTLGNLANCMAMRVNGGRMPVITKEPGKYRLQNELHSHADESIRYRFLVDRYDVGFGIVSLGDILTVIGAAGLAALILT